ncbi:mediator of DNA damage checkpoint protein 1-like [Rhopilema esculentum]|uniref:mediator of DNA damage checkpoint protein 1-like n=1 Tax=Rhopilema esculentum TaxID=499914 RepID=UPI0031D1B45D
MEIEATQAMDANCESEEEDERPRDKRIVAVLKVHKQKGYEEQEFPIYEGRNIVGRHEKSDIYISAAPVSKKHACIEVVSGVHLIFDYGSKNKTKRGQLVLRPQVRYELTDGVKLAFADCECRYSCTHEQPQADDTDSMQESVEERACVTDEINTSSQSTQKLSNQDRHSTNQIIKGRHASVYFF